MIDFYMVPEKIGSPANLVVKYDDLDSLLDLLSSLSIHISTGLEILSPVDIISNPKKKTPSEILLFFSKPIEDLIRSKRALKALKSNDIFTVEDFIRFGKRCDGKRGNDFKLLLKTPQFGNRSYNELMNILRENGIIDKDGNSHLFEYIVQF